MDNSATREFGASEIAITHSNYIIYSVSTEDVQSVAHDWIGRSLSTGELEHVEHDLEDDLGWEYVQSCILDCIGDFAPVRIQP